MDRTHMLEMKENKSSGIHQEPTKLWGNRTAKTPTLVCNSLGWLNPHSNLITLALPSLGNSHLQEVGNVYSPQKGCPSKPTTEVATEDNE